MTSETMVHHDGTTQPAVDSSEPLEASSTKSILSAK